MNRVHVAFCALVLVSAGFALAPTAGASHCNVLQPTTVSTNTTTVTVPLPASVGPATVPAQTVGGQTVGGQTVGPVTLPLIATISGVPVVGTVTIGGQTVGPATVPAVTIPQHTVGPVTVGPIPTGLGPVTVTVHGQSATVPLSLSCTLETLLEELDPILDCVRDIRNCVASA